MAHRPAVVLVHGFWGGAAHWPHVIVELHRRGFTDLHAVENPLTSLADDAERTRKMVRQVDGPVLPVGHSYGGAVITEAGGLPNVTGLVYIAAFAPEAGASPGQISQEMPPAAFENIAPDSDGYPPTSSRRRPANSPARKPLHGTDPLGHSPREPGRIRRRRGAGTAAVHGSSTVPGGG